VVVGDSPVVPLITRVSFTVVDQVVRNLLRSVEIERAVRRNGVIIAVEHARTAASVRRSCC